MTAPTDTTAIWIGAVALAVVLLLLLAILAIIRRLRGTLDPNYRPRDHRQRNWIVRLVLTGVVLTLGSIACVLGGKGLRQNNSGNLVTCV